MFNNLICIVIKHLGMDTTAHHTETLTLGVNVVNFTNPFTHHVQQVSSDCSYEAGRVIVSSTANSVVE